MKLSKDIPKDILSVTNEAEIKEYIDENKISVYGFDENVAFLMGVEVFGELADVEFYLADKNVVEMNAVYYLFSVGSDEEYPNDTDVIEEDEPIYQFTLDDKDSITNKFNKVKENFEEYIGCSFEKYDLVPTHDAETLEDNDESFYNGDYIKEYSVRDANGTLWLMRYEASMGSSIVVISKIVDE